MTAKIGVAISTTGHPHRMEFLETCVRRWVKALPSGAPVYVTVDGSEKDFERVQKRIWGLAEIYRVGQPLSDERLQGAGRQGVAVNKNTGIELLMNAGVEHLFLSDDDCWPLYPQSLDKHIRLAEHSILHSGVYWGRHRRAGVRTDPDGFSWSEWTWPRGVMLYAQRPVIEIAGGMREEFGIGGHEHVEWSRRIGNLGLTPEAFCAPASYDGHSGLGAAALWHAEDMPRLGESLHTTGQRRRDLTTVPKKSTDEWDRIEAIMERTKTSTDFVPYTARENGRMAATMASSTPPMAEEPGEHT